MPGNFPKHRQIRLVKLQKLGGRFDCGVISAPGFAFFPRLPGSLCLVARSSDVHEKGVFHPFEKIRLGSCEIAIFAQRLGKLKHQRLRLAVIKRRLASHCLPSFALKSYVQAFSLPASRDPMHCGLYFPSLLGAAAFKGLSFAGFAIREEPSGYFGILPFGTNLRIFSSVLVRMSFNNSPMSSSDNPLASGRNSDGSNSW